MTDQHRNYWTLRQNLRFSSDEKQKKNRGPVSQKVWYGMNPSQLSHWTEKDTFCSLAVSLPMKHSKSNAKVHSAITNQCK